MAVFDAQHGGFATGWSPVSWGSINELFVNLTMPSGSHWQTRVEHAFFGRGTPYGATKRPRLVWLLAGRPLMARVASPTRGVVA